MSEQQDITKHPLYLPHHGDMTGWRYLEMKEVCKPGDESSATPLPWVDADAYGWVGVTQERAFNNRLKQVIFRRRIAPVATDQKRFVTVVLHGDDSILVDVLGRAECYREGNYLEKFDGIKERVNKAMEGDL